MSARFGFGVRAGWCRDRQRLPRWLEPGGDGTARRTIMSVILSGRRAGGGRSPPRVDIAQSTDLGTVVTYLGERGGDEVRGRVRGTRRAGNAQAASRRLRGVRVPGGRHFELVVVGPLDRPAESLPAVAQRADGLGSA